MGQNPSCIEDEGGSLAMSVHRRTVLKGMLGTSAIVAAPAIVRAQSGPMKVGFLTVKTGPLASGGIQMEQGLTLYLKERNNMLAGRPVQLFTGDSAGAPAMARTKMQEFLERENIACLSDRWRPPRRSPLTTTSATSRSRRSRSPPPRT